MAADGEWWRAFFEGPWTQVQAAGYAADLTQKEVDFIVTALELQQGQRVLDVPCGEGRHSIALAARGFAVTGVDFNEGALAVARRRAAEGSVQVEFVRGDMRELAAPEPFDAALCFYGSFGYFGDDDNLRHARSMAGALREGGKLLIDLHVLESLLPRYAERHWAWTGEPDASMRVMQENRWDLAAGRILSSWAFVDPQGGVRTGQSSMRVYTYRELCALLREAGFRELRGVETLSGSEFQLGSRRLSLIATR